MAFRLILAAMCAVAVVSSALAQELSSITGTCASIGYSTACCPRGAQCQASDGNCNCGSNCHLFRDCCSDVHCPANPSTCRDVGFTSCCNGTNRPLRFCDVRSSASSRCSCNLSCHERNDCCSDAEAIGCIPRTCAEAGIGAGCCSWSSSSSCFVGGGNCYCDSYCIVFNDCCDDVRMPECPAANGNGRRSRVQSNMKQEFNTPSYAHPFKARYLEPNPQSQNVYVDRYAYQREALAARAQRIKTASYPREYRARARTAVRRPQTSG